MDDCTSGASCASLNGKDDTKMSLQSSDVEMTKNICQGADEDAAIQSPVHATTIAQKDSPETGKFDITNTPEPLDETAKRESAAVSSQPVKVQEEYETDNERELDVARDMAYTTYLRAPHFEGTKLDLRRKNGKKRSLQASQYLVLVEDRLKELEYEVKRLQMAQNVKPEEVEVDVPSSEDPATLVLAPALLDWSEFSMAPHVRNAKPTSAIDVLIEKPYSFTKLSSRHQRRVSKSLTRQASRQVERIRINSYLLSQVLEDIIGGDTVGLTGHLMRFGQHLRPFKVIIPYTNEIRAKLADLEHMLSREDDTIVSSSDGDKGTTPRSDTASNKDISPEEAVSDNEEDASKVTQHEAERYELIQTKDHTKSLVECFETMLSAEMDDYNRLRFRRRSADEICHPTKVSFPELWYLLAPGDLVFDSNGAQALRILAVRGGNTYLVDEVSPPPANMSRDPQTGRYVESEVSQRLKTTEVLSEFVLTCFYLSFDGTNFGPVQIDISIEPFEGSILVTSLPVIPIEYADGSTFYGERGGRQATDPDKSLQELMLDRGRLYVDLARPGEAAHRDYSGFSLEAIREQIDSQVIVDLDLYYQKMPRPFDMGLRAIPQSDFREYYENYMQPCECREDECTTTATPIFEDRKIDELRTKRFLDDHRFLVRFAEQNSQALMTSREDCLVLFPRRIPAFILRSRTWAALDVSKIRKLRPQVQSFEQLVLPQSHKDIVEALVKTHSRGARPVRDAVGDEDTDRREDLVRGKGKGVILLLHGVPGVGKTSTAECVAEYTNRPLFALTCGDIGDNAGDVQKSLNESFQLAHRWGCVMLLDEADVFLQSRARDRDLSRNAVVSVFLGMLEYYSGILFLTTNKIGTFDEAFKSRIHVSLYYKELDEEQTLEIWRINLQRIKVAREGRITFEEKKMMKWMKKLFHRNERDKLRPWNGRQIRNACQTAAALAEFQNNGEITKGELEAVADTSAQFDRYLLAIYGKDDMARAQERSDRGDLTFEEVLLKTMREMHKAPLVQRKRDEEVPGPTKSKGRSDKKSKKKDPEPAPVSSSSSDSDSSD